MLTDGTATPVMIFDPLLTSEKVYILPNRSLIWQGTGCTIMNFIQVFPYPGGYIPKDSPASSILTSTLTEQVIAGIFSSLGIISTIFFLSFNLYYRKHR